MLSSSRHLFGVFLAAFTCRRVFQYLITDRFELLPLRTLAHTHVRLIDILLVEKEINGSQRLANTGDPRLAVTIGGMAGRFC
jgi:hypothetical protein